MLDYQLTEDKAHLLSPKLSKPTQKMKYSQACLLKKQVDATIKKLTKTIMGPGVTEATRIRLAIVHVSVAWVGNGFQG